MSINLICDQFNLYQTPTDIAYHCYFNKNTKRMDSWQNIRDKYISWLMRSKSHDEDYREMAEEHAKDLMSYPYLKFDIG